MNRRERTHYIWNWTKQFRNWIALIVSSLSIFFLGFISVHILYLAKATRTQRWDGSPVQSWNLFQWNIFPDCTCTSAIYQFISDSTVSTFTFNLRTCKGGGGGGWHPHKVFQSFFLEDKTSSLDVFSSCSFIPYAHFETRLVMVSRYGYDIWRHK